MIRTPGLEENSEEVSAAGPPETLQSMAWGYRPDGVGRPTDRFSPVDDGTEWNMSRLRDWVLGCNSDGRRVMRALAKKLIIDPRDTAFELGMDGTQWAGTWNGPRKKAERIMKDRQLLAWPYGHSYDEPRRLWIHPEIAKRVLAVLDTTQ